MNSDGHVEDVWDRYWKAWPDWSAWDDQSELIYRVIRQQAPDGSEFDRVLEVGSGTGRISAALARDGRRVCLLDTSAHALQIARNVFHQSRTRGDFVRASGMHLPFHD